MALADRLDQVPDALLSLLEERAAEGDAFGELAQAALRAGRAGAGEAAGAARAAAAHRRVVRARRGRLAPRRSRCCSMRASWAVRTPRRCAGWRRCSGASPTVRWSTPCWLRPSCTSASSRCCPRRPSSRAPSCPTRRSSAPCWSGWCAARAHLLREGQQQQRRQLARRGAGRRDAPAGRQAGGGGRVARPSSRCCARPPPSRSPRTERARVRRARGAAGGGRAGRLRSWRSSCIRARSSWRPKTPRCWRRWARSTRALGRLDDLVVLRRRELAATPSVARRL